MIELTNVTKIYGTGETAVHALKEVSLKLQPGVFTAITGKSGSGKSTLMNIIGGLDKPTSGSVALDGKDLSGLDSVGLAQYRNRTVGFIFQSFYLEPAFTVLDNVCLPLTIRGVSKRDREAQAVQILNSLGLEDKVYKRANQLSGGQKQRVCIARALAGEPSIVLADEPTGNLDTENGTEVIKILKDICLTGKTVVLVTHNPDDAMKADRIITIKDGKIVSQ